MKPLPKVADVDRLDAGVTVTYCPQPTSYTGVVSMVVVRNSHLAVFDTGVSDFMPAALFPCLDQLHVRADAISAICCTHGHFDHCGGSNGLRELSAAPVYMSSGDVELADFVPDVALADGDRVDVGDMSFEVIATPGHTAGSVCFYEPMLGLLIVGDSVQGSGSSANGLLPVYFHSGQDYRAGLERLLRLQATTVIMGHPLEWSGEASCIHSDEGCLEMLKESLSASESIAEAAASVVRDMGVTVASNADLPVIRHEILRRLSHTPTFRNFDPDGIVGASTDATVRSELRDLGVEPR